MAKNQNALNFSVLTAAFADEEKAREIIEASRWPEGPVCPHCESREVTRLKRRETSARPGRPGLLKCRTCRKQFTVKVGTVMEGSHIPLNQWLFAIHAMNVSKKGVSAHQLHRTLGVDYKTAWFLCHRVRFAMEHGPLKGKVGEKMSGTVEADETYVGPRNRGGKRGRGAEKKQIVFALVNRKGEARTFHVPNVQGKTLKGIIRDNVEGDASIYTDSFPSYKGLAKEFAAHETVDHGADEYVRGDVHVNFAESYFSLLKRGVIGIFHHISAKHMHRYLAEFDHRWNRRDITDGERVLDTLRNLVSERLYYKMPTVKTTATSIVG
jgi:transposase-like protein